MVCYVVKIICQLLPNTDTRITWNIVQGSKTEMSFQHESGSAGTTLDIA